MPRTQLMLEVQITKEYLGFATHLVYLAPLFEETLLSDTYAKGKDSTVCEGQSMAHCSVHAPHTTGMAGVANIGSDRNWTGSHFDQANWYAFGRLAWDPTLTSADIAAEWVKMTFSTDPAFVSPVVGMMMGSREAAVEYMTPLGLHHQMARHTHYGPGPWVGGGARADWTSVYFNRADARGIGFDRTATGSNAVAQYAPQVAGQFADLKRVPEKYLLWFHHVPWDYHLASGRTLWDELVIHYSQGVQRVLRYAQDLGRPRSLRGSRALCAGERISGHSGKGGPVVARREHRVLPDICPPATACRLRASRARPPILRVALFPLRARRRAAAVVQLAREVGLGKPV